MKNFELKCCFFYQEGIDLSYNDDYINSMPENKIIYYNHDTKKFVDYNLEDVNLENTILFPISGYEQVNVIKAQAESDNINLLLSSEDTKKVDDWLDYYQPKRQMFKVTGQELHDRKHLKYASSESEFFLKTKIKNFSSKAKIKYLNNHSSVLSQALDEHYNTDFYISELIDIEKDKIGVKEYRAVVIDNKICNISRMTNLIYHKIEKNILDKAQAICDQVKNTDFPNFYILDVMVYKDHNNEEVVDVVEFNDISSSGTYLYNSIIDLNRDNILHDDIEKLPFTFNMDKSVLKYNGKIPAEPHNFYDKEGGFAKTVKELSGLNAITNADIILGNKAILTDLENKTI